jgi:drug/metabolite transporter (DMT)-like permease
VNTLLVAIVSVTFSVVAQFLLKAGMSGSHVKSVLEKPLSPYSLFEILTDRFVLAGFLCYGLGAIIWLAVLSRWDVSKAYPLVGLGFVFTAALAFIAGEHVTLSRAVGTGLIVAGVFVVSQS